MIILKSMFLCVTIFVLFPHHLTDFFFMRVFMSILVNMSYKGAPKLIVKQAIMAVLSILVFVYLYAPPLPPFSSCCVWYDIATGQ